jgi:hypothetical protein
MTHNAEVIRVRNKKSGEVYSCVAQLVDLNFDGKYCLRFNIGIDGYNEWTHIENIYSNDEFNEKYEVVKYQKSKKMWVLEKDYKFWLDEESAN